MWRAALLLVGSLFICVIVVWWSRTETQGSDHPARDLGGLDFPAAMAESSDRKATGRPAGERPVPPLTSSPNSNVTVLAGPARPLHDPIVIPACSLVPAEEQDVSSQVDGVFHEVLVELGNQVVPG